MPGPYKCTHQTKKLLSPMPGDSSFLFTMLRQHEALQRPDAQHKDAERDAVPAEHREGVLFDIIHQEADRKDRDDKRHNAAHQQRADLTERKDAALGKELDQLEAGGTRHDRDGQKEGTGTRRRGSCRRAGRR